MTDDEGGQCRKMTHDGRKQCKETAWSGGYCAKHQPRANRLTTPPKIKLLDPDKPLAPHHVPALKTFDRHMPGQGMLDLGADGEFEVTYPGDADQP